MRKVLVTSRSFGQASDRPFQILDHAGIAYTLMGVDFDYDVFKETVQEYDALIIGAHKFDPEDLAKCDRLQIICKHGTGLDNIPLETAKEKGITVTNVPSMNADAVADLTFAHMLNISRGISVSSAGVRAGKGKTFTGRDVWGKTLGLVGFGAIGKAVSHRAAGFSMKVLAFDPYVETLPDELRGIVTFCGFDRVVAECDIVSIHTPLTDETKDLFDKHTIMRMRKDAILINTARGGIVNEDDLYECMKGGHLFGAALDVTVDEPTGSGHPLLTLDNVVITPHIGMYSIEALSAVGILCAENVARKFCGEEPLYRVV
jgi:D-3-phosphoglycerate dehydrogenase